MTKATKNTSDVSMDDFIDLAVHDLDAPLRKVEVLMGMMMTASKWNEQDGPGQYAQRIRKQVAAMRALIDGLAKYTELSKNDKKIELIDLNKLLLVVKSELEPLILEKNSTVTIGPLSFIEGDVKQLHELFKQLLNNSCLFTAPGEAADVKVYEQEITGDERSVLKSQNEFIKIIIEDKGIGFDSDQAEKIFEPFVRLNGKSEFEGSGIGLALCRRIVLHHDGILYAESEKDKGTRFILILPKTLR